MQPVARDEQFADERRFLRLQLCVQNCFRKLKARAEIIEQFADDDGWRTRTIVADGLAGVADVKFLSRGEQHFEKEITVVIAARGVAGFWLRGHQIKTQWRGAAWKIVVVHAEHAKRATRNIPHRVEAGKSHAPAQNRLARWLFREFRQHAFENDLKRNFFGKTGNFLLLAQAVENLADGVGGKFLFAVGRK